MTRCYYVGWEEGIKVQCEGEGRYGAKAGDPTFAHSPYLRKARYCKKHKHWDDVLRKEKDDGKD